MKQINPKGPEEIKIENPLKLLGKKTIHFKVEKFPNAKKYSKKSFKDNLNEGRWSYSEHLKFIRALSKDGPNWKKISETFNYRTLSQIRSHAQKFFQRLKRCKNNELGIDFTTNSIKSFKDMINHIKSVNINNDINNIFLYLSDINQNSLIELAKNAKTEELPHLIAPILSCHYEELINRENDFINKNKINISNSNSEIFNKDNNRCDNVNNKVNFFLLNYLSNSINLNILINKLYNNCLENINQAISNFAQISFIKDLSSLNNSNINEIRKNINEL